MFDYKGDHYVIVPENRRDWYVCCGEDIKHYTSVDPIMNEKIYHGKSLAEIADKLYNIEYA
ncbi:MAG: hypothetical protein IJ849_02020 [Selenomonadaceae bacterium]|nr:hypothetical protein [Selenomonadaceae bacterium]